MPNKTPEGVARQSPILPTRLARLAPEAPRPRFQNSRQCQTPKMPQAACDVVQQVMGQRGRVTCLDMTLVWLYTFSSAVIDDERRGEEGVVIPPRSHGDSRPQHAASSGLAEEAGRRAGE